MDISNINEIHIEPTRMCNAQCPQCARNILGEGLNPNIRLGSLPLQWYENNLTIDNISKIKKILFCGNLGDPCASPNLIDAIKYIKSINENIIIGIHTNGSLKTKEWFKKLGNILQGTNDYTVFSIDGLEDNNHVYRRNTSWKKIMQNAESYISTGASAHWDMLIFDHNKHQINECKELATKMGFKWFRSKQTDRWDTFPLMDNLMPAEPPSNVDYSKSIPICEKDRDKSIYIDHTGKLWPCCHIAEAYLIEIGKELHTDIRQYSNTELLTEYKIKLNNQPFYVCRRYCGKTTGKRSQWKQEIQIR